MFQSHIQTNWDWWVTETHADCTERMAKMPLWKTKLCDKVLGVAYNDSTCSDLCQLYSDGRREAGNADLQARLASAGGKADIDLILAVMSNTSSEVLNSDTKITSIMNSRTRYYSTLVRENDGGLLNAKARASSKAKARERLIEAGKVMLDAVLEAWREE